MDWPDRKTRCPWANPNNPRYLQYHDKEWGVPVHDDQKLFEMLILENFQAGLSWECVLNKWEAFSRAFDGFNLEKVCSYGPEEQARLKSDPGIIRNGRKIAAAVQNARVFREIQREWGSFDRYLWHWTEGQVVCEQGLSLIHISGLSPESSVPGRPGWTTCVPTSTCPCRAAVTPP